MLAPSGLSHTNKATETTTTVIPPLLHVSRGNPETGSRPRWRCSGTTATSPRRPTLGLPLYYDVHEYHLSRTTVLLPLFVRHADEVAHDTTTGRPAALFYRHTTPTDSTTVGFPLLWDFKHGADRTTVVFPFYAHWRRPDHVGDLGLPELLPPRGAARRRHGPTAPTAASCSRSTTPA